MIDSPSRRSARCCHNSSVINGMNGCSRRSNESKYPSVALYVWASIGEPYAGFTISRYQLENSSQKSLYTAINASDMRNLPSRSVTSAAVSRTFDSNHFKATLETSGCAAALSTSQPFTRRNAFHILLQKLRPCSQSFSSNIISLPAGAASIMPMRTPSAP
ncbi:hypothetical protein IMSAGC006_01119 [Muribaculaceae bacterium]|nr:hypothetical protein IMSAGC006_01119 [Muribaculaceae bacterium]